MYIRKNIRRYRDKTYINHLLVESVHTPKGPRQKTVCSLGNLSPRPAKEWLKLARKIEDALLGQEGLFYETDAETKEIIKKVKERQEEEKADTKDSDNLITVEIDKVDTTFHREAGSAHVGYQF